jgi:hypothetical protein
MGLQLTSRTISSFANSWGFCIWQRVRTSENGCERKRNVASRHRHVARKGNFVTQAFQIRFRTHIKNIFEFLQ